MADLSDLLRPSTVVSGIAAANKKALFQQLSTLVGERLDVDHALAQERMVAREKLGTTGFGGGIAIPHGRMPGIDRVRGLFVRLSRPVDFKAVDQLPVDLVFVLLSPEDAGGTHLKALARVSRALRDRSLAEKLRGAGSPDALYALLTQAETRDAA
ncbi:PTS sugar transporter subunit IIA [Sphingomonas sp.]